MPKKVNFFLENLLARYFPSVRGIVLLIVLPAFVIIISQLFYSFIQIVVAKDHDRMVDYEIRFAALKKDLPIHTFVNYVSMQDYSGDYYSARYVLIPVRLVRGLKPQYNYLVAHFSDPNNIPTIDGYTLKKNYGNGIALFTRSSD
jgi:hypothetical protein